MNQVSEVGGLEIISSPSKIAMLDKDSLFATALHAEDRLDLLEDNQLQTGGGCKPCPDRNKSCVQGLRSALGHDLRKKRWKTNQAVYLVFASAGTLTTQSTKPE